MELNALVLSPTINHEPHNTLNIVKGRLYPGDPNSTFFDQTPLNFVTIYLNTIQLLWNNHFPLKLSKAMKKKNVDGAVRRGRNPPSSF